MGQLAVDPAHTALVIVDMQNDFCSGRGYYALAGRDTAPIRAAIEPNRRLLQRARKAGLSVVFTRLVPDPERGSIEERHRIVPRRWSVTGRRLEPRSWGAGIVDDLRPREGELVIDKHGYSAFDGTALENRLRAAGITTLLISGVVTYACVLATAFGAFDRGFDVVLVSDAVGSWGDGVGGNGPDGLGARARDIVDLLLGRAEPADQISFGDA